MRFPRRKNPSSSFSSPEVSGNLARVEAIGMILAVLRRPGPTPSAVLDDGRYGT